LEEEEKEQGQE